MGFEFDMILHETEIAKSCRVCLNKEIEMLSIFKHCENELLNIHDMITACCCIEIKPNDGLPQQICLACMNDAKVAFSFKKRCEKTQHTLKCLLGQSSNNQDPVTTIKDEINGLSNEFDEKNDLKLEEPADLLNLSFYLDHDAFENVDVKEEDAENISDINISLAANCKRLSFLSKKIKPIHKKSIKGKKKTYKNIVGINKSDLKEKSSSVLSCSYCDFTTKLPSQLRTHLYIHTGQKPLSCDLCDFRCIQSSSLKNHKLIHLKEKPFGCTFCEYKSTNSSNLNRHMRIHTNSKPYSCNQCSYRCTQSAHLKEHEKRHSGEKPYLCDQCHYRCSAVSSLNAHKRNKHSHERKFSCAQCNFKCKNKNSLVYHIRGHTGDKRFTCDMCSYKALRLVSLQTHKKMAHTQERPYACDQCTYKCVSLSYLRSHMLTHRSVKIFSCDICGYSCHTNFKLKSHKWTHSGEKPYHCSSCDFKCSSSSSLKRHQRRNHNMIISK